LAVLAALAVAAHVACEGDRPAAPDGAGVIAVTIVDTTGTYPGAQPGEPAVIGSAKVSLQARTHEYSAGDESGDDGIAEFGGLPAGEYSVFARREMPIGAQKKVFTGYADIFVEGPGLVSDTLFVSTVTVNALMINEIYYCGSNYASFYFYDQYIEIYNSSEDTLYLDGCILTRNFPTVEGDLEEIDHVRAIYAFRFPGSPVTGREHPISPGQYIVVAADAIDHSRWSANGYDLSGADWEFFNPLGSDYDVPGVPNVVNINPDKTTDFMINLSSNAIVLATGEEYTVEEYVDSNGYSHLRVTLPLYTVIDGVEYAANSDHTKELTMRVDAGFAGVGCAKYSGATVERREVGVDTNNSTFDFVLIPRGTPGYTHVQ
jgi:hypothetical protein